MSERKPRGVSFESWVERQVREARERGAFDDLPGTGKPLPRTDGDELAWLREKMRREDLPVAALLPPSLALAKEVEDLPLTLSRLRGEPRVRAYLADLNTRIEAARRGPQIGPLMRTRVIDVEPTVEQWRARQPVPAPTEVGPRRPAPRDRWWRGRRPGPSA